MCFQNGALAISTKREKNNEKPSMVKKGNQSIQLGINKLPKKKEKRKNKRERSEKYKEHECSVYDIIKASVSIYMLIWENT
jgi:hypothetical protein